MSARRVLILPDATGAPVLTATGVPTGVRIVPTVYTEEAWSTPSVPDLTSAVDLAPGTVRFPGPGQLVGRLLEFSRASAADVSAEQAAVDDLMSGTGTTHGDLHRTQTTDFFVVVSGEVTLESEKGDVELTAGQTAICLGALHGWRCRSETPAQVFAVLVGARDFGDTGGAGFMPSSDVAGDGVRRVVLGHDPAGTATILDDRAVPAASRLWLAAGSVPTNVPGHDPLAGPGPLSDDGIEFHVLAVDTGSHAHLGAQHQQLLGVVVSGAVTLAAAGSGDSAVLAAGDLFVSSGFDLTVTAPSDTDGRIGFVAVPGAR